MTPFSFYAATDIGKVRSNNEDTFIAKTIWDENHLILSAIDGVGGYEGGEVAAALAKDNIVDYLAKHHDRDLLTTVKRSVIAANNCIVREKQKSRNNALMGCVASTALIDLEKMTANIAHVGDTRIYFSENHSFRKITHDHSLVGYREDIGELTEEEAMRHPQRNIIERALGDAIKSMDDNTWVDTSIVSIPPDGKILLCSDGLSDLLTSAEIKEIISESATTENKVRKLITSALDKGGKDNITVVLLEFAGKINVMPKSNGNEILDLPSSSKIKKYHFIFLCVFLVLLVGFWITIRHFA